MAKNTAPAMLQNFANETKKSKSGSGGGIDEEIADSNYEDDDFEIGSGMARSEGQEKASDDKDFFNQNKNFTGHLGAFASKKSNTKLSEKPSENESGIGFTDNYYEDFF